MSPSYQYYHRMTFSALFDTPLIYTPITATLIICKIESKLVAGIINKAVCHWVKRYVFIWFYNFKSLIPANSLCGKLVLNFACHFILNRVMTSDSRIKTYHYSHSIYKKSSCHIPCNHHCSYVLPMQGMEEILECFLKDDNPDMTRQIQFIIKQLNTGGTFMLLHIIMHFCQSLHRLSSL